MYATHTQSVCCQSSTCKMIKLQVCQVKELEHWQLYLVDWGYNTQQERERAASNPRIHVVNHEQMSQAMIS